jgi:hypothetical protein
MQKTDEPWRMIVKYSKLNLVVAPTAAAVPALVSLLQQINSSFGIQYAVIYMANAFIYVCS